MQRNTNKQKHFVLKAEFLQKERSCLMLCYTVGVGNMAYICLMFKYIFLQGFKDLKIK